MRTSWAIAWELQTRARNRRKTALAGTRLILQTAKHATRGEGRGGSGHRMNSDKEKKLGLARGNHGDDETVTGSGVRMGAWGCAGLHKSVRMPHCVAHSLSRTFAGRLSHARKYFANDKLIAAVIQLQIGVRHFERSDGPAIAKAHKCWPRQSGIGRVEAEAICYGNQLFTREICS